MDFPIFTKAGPTRIARQLASVPVEMAPRNRSVTSSGVRYSGYVILHLAQASVGTIAPRIMNTEAIRC
ncbi:hypothetical protein ASD04_17530 [Devosia sp. Root436]|nr:hypothetical protein ASD04_17530 [Devosia sp. Root436]